MTSKATNWLSFIVNDEKLMVMGVAALEKKNNWGAERKSNWSFFNLILVNLIECSLFNP